MNGQAVRWPLLAGLVVGMAGCATVGAPTQASYDEHMASARAAGEAGSTRVAVDAYREAIAADPADKAPWLGIARIEADRQRPVEALSAVQEVLRRDPADEDASALYLDVVLQLASDGLGRVRALVPERRADYLSGTQGLVGDAIELFGDQVVPVEARARYGSEAVERYRRNLPVPPEGKHEKVPDPLDVLGGR